mmetsp:Transcript_128340/g.251385  ORF Transcript_128340/g.251385 Transcript_128340/m.251385 type:complete len:252 (-) Transcript_128340:240-995(-)
MTATTAATTTAKAPMEERTNGENATCADNFASERPKLGPPLKGFPGMDSNAPGDSVPLVAGGMGACVVVGVVVGVAVSDVVSVVSSRLVVVVVSSQAQLSGIVKLWTHGVVDNEQPPGHALSASVPRLQDTTAEQVSVPTLGKMAVWPMSVPPQPAAALSCTWNDSVSPGAPYWQYFMGRLNLSRIGNGRLHSFWFCAGNLGIPATHSSLGHVALTIVDGHCGWLFLSSLAVIVMHTSHMPVHFMPSPLMT